MSATATQNETGGGQVDRPLSTSAPVFEVRGLSKFYGDIRGVEDINLEVHPGEIFGFLGPNGAGKTTVIRTALGLLRPTAGDIRLFGDIVRLQSDRHHERLGYLPADLRLWSRIRGRRLSELFLKIGGQEIDRAWRDEVAERIDLDLDRNVKSLSLGNRQKVGLLLALQHRPALVILDEPTSGLDPLIRRKVYDLLRDMADQGSTIIYSSHNLPEVEQLCTRVAILRNGQLSGLKTIEELKAEQERHLAVTFTRADDMPEKLPETLSGFRLVSRSERSMEIAWKGSPDLLIRWLGEFDLDEVESRQVSLEEAFLSFY